MMNKINQVWVISDDKVYINKMVSQVMVMALLLVLQGCSVSRYVSENYVSVAKKIPFKARHPIAQKIKYIYAHGNIVSGTGGFTGFLVATNLQTSEQLNNRGMQYIKKKYPAVKNKHFSNTSTLNKVIHSQKSTISAQGRAAQNKYDSGRSLNNNQAASVQTLGMAESFDSSIDMMNMAISMVGIAKSWVHAKHEANGNALIHWLNKNTGAIGPSAPKGSVLHVDFITVMKAKSFQVASNSEIIVSAYLERPGKKTIYSSQGIQFSVFGKDKLTKRETKGLVNYVDRDVTLVNDLPQMQSIKNINKGVFHAVLASAAIADIYRQLSRGRNK